MAQNYKSDIKLGETYRDSHTGFEGIANAIYFYLYGCERVCLRAKDLEAGKIVELVFDGPELTNVKTGKTVVVTKTGGPHDRAPIARR